MRDRQTSPPIHTKTYRTNPWLTPRFWVVPGEPYGRGPGLVGLPYVKTLNKVQELNLHAAAFALLATCPLHAQAADPPKDAGKATVEWWLATGDAATEAMNHQHELSVQSLQELHADLH